MKNEEKIKETISKAAKGIGDAATAAAGKTGELAAAAKEKIVDVVDVNGNGEIDLEDFIKRNTGSMTYGGEKLTDEEQQQVLVAMRTIFWRRHKHD